MNPEYDMPKNANYEANLQQQYAAKYATAQQYAVSQGTLGAYAGTDVAPPTLMSDIAGRLQTLNMVISDAAGDLASLSDRLFGAVPRGVSGSSAANKPMGQVSELLSHMDGLIELASAVREEARRLNGRI